MLLELVRILFVPTSLCLLPLAFCLFLSAIIRVNLRLINPDELSPTRSKRKDSTAATNWFFHPDNLATPAWSPQHQEPRSTLVIVQTSRTRLAPSMDHAASQPREM